MELRIEKVTFPEVIEFNFDELQQEITSKVADYANLVYTDEQIKEAKADRAKLNAFTKALSDERIKVKKQCMAPYEEFEKKVKTLEGIVQKAAANIDAQVKGYEEKKKEEKLEAVRALWTELTPPERIPFEVVFQQKFLNASTSMKVVKQYFMDAIDKYKADIQTLEALDAFSFEAIEEYHRTFNIGMAITEGKRLAELQKRIQKKKEEQAAREEAERLAKENAAAEAEFAKCMNPPETQEAEPEPQPTPAPDKQWIAFQALLSVEDAGALRDFCQSRGIELKPI